MTATFILSGLRVEKRDLGTIFDGVRVMHETTAYDYYVEEGEIRNSHRLLLAIGREKYGAPNVETEATLKAIKDLDRLERMSIASVTAKSWQELLTTP